MSDAPHPGKYTYAAVSPNTNEWTTKDGSGKFTDFRVKLVGEGDTVFVRTCKGHGETVKAPQVGQEIDVKEFKENGNFPLKLVLNYGNGGYGGGKGGGGDFRSPDQIMRGYALHSAVELANATIAPEERTASGVIAIAQSFYEFQKGAE